MRSLAVVSLIMEIPRIKPEPRREDFERFLAPLLPRLNAFARQLAGSNSELARDIAQEAIIKGFQSYMAGKLELSNRTISWLATVARNEFLMMKRKDRRIVDFSEEEGGYEAHIPPHDGQRDADNSDTREILNQALAELPEEQREVVELVDMNQFDYEEAADILGIPVGTVRSRLSRARLKLAAKLHFMVNPA
jgi:RNA polymerase sigma-70 factor (ECF subfamily)